MSMRSPPGAEGGGRRGGGSEEPTGPPLTEVHSDRSDSAQSGPPRAEERRAGP